MAKNKATKQEVCHMGKALKECIASMLHGFNAYGAQLCLVVLTCNIL
jgi:hypothetical protein